MPRIQKFLKFGSVGVLKPCCTIAAGRIRALTAARPITPISPRCPSAWQLNPAEAPPIDAENLFRQPGPRQIPGSACWRAPRHNKSSRIFSECVSSPLGRFVISSGARNMGAKRSGQRPDVQSAALARPRRGSALQCRANKRSRGQAHDARDRTPRGTGRGASARRMRLSLAGTVIRCDALPVTTGSGPMPRRRWLRYRCLRVSLKPESSKPPI